MRLTLNLRSAGYNFIVMVYAEIILGKTMDWTTVTARNADTSIENIAQESIAQYWGHNLIYDMDHEATARQAAEDAAVKELHSRHRPPPPTHDHVQPRQPSPKREATIRLEDFDVPLDDERSERGGARGNHWRLMQNTPEDVIAALRMQVVAQQAEVMQVFTNYNNVMAKLQACTCNGGRRDEREDCNYKAGPSKAVCGRRYQKCNSWSLDCT